MIFVVQLGLGWVTQVTGTELNLEVVKNRKKLENLEKETFLQNNVTAGTSHTVSCAKNY